MDEKTAAEQTNLDKAQAILEKAGREMEALGFLVRAREVSLSDLIGDGYRFESVRPSLEIFPVLKPGKKKAEG